MSFSTNVPAYYAFFDEHSERTRSIACDAGRALHREGLGNLMRALGHPEDEARQRFAEHFHGLELKVWGTDPHRTLSSSDQIPAPV